MKAQSSGISGEGTGRRRAKLVEGDTLSEAWLLAYEHLVEVRGKDVNLMVVMPGNGVEDSTIRSAIDNILPAGHIETVANTIFPQELYHPSLEERAASHLYDEYELAYSGIRMHRGNQRGTYFGRLVRWEATTSSNQLDAVIKRLRSAAQQVGPKSSAYEISVAGPGELGELRIQHPGDRSPMGFPCLSHISLTLVDGELHMSALYRNQHFIHRAYGNYLGLSRLLQFICIETGFRPGDIACWATHADAELADVNRRHALHLIGQCRAQQAVD